MRRGSARRMRAGILGVGMLAGMAGIVHAEIVPATPPRVLAPVAVPQPAPAGIVPPREDRPEVPPTGAMPADVGQAVPEPGQATPMPMPELPPQPSDNIRWPSVPAQVGPAGEVADVVEDGAATVPADDAAEVVAPPDDPFQRALVAYRGEGNPRSYGEAARWFKVAADAGDRRAAIAHAYLQGLGLGVARDPAAARRTLQEASDAGIARADYLISLLLDADRRPGGDRQQDQLRERAARRGDPVAENSMGVHYQVQGDRTTAEMWYRRAADHGSAAAGLNLASLARGDETRRQLEAGAEATGDGDAGSLFEQARRHHRGDGVPVDYGKALRLYREAAAKGSKPAQQMLGLIQSRSLPDGGFDPGWMRQLASAAVGQAGGNPVPSVAPAAQPRLDDPLAGLPGLGP